MKKVLLLIMLFCNLAFSQDYPRDAMDLLIGKELKIIPNKVYSERGYSDFYKNKDYYSIKSKGYYKKMNAKYDVFNLSVFKLLSFENVNNSLGKRMLSLELYNDKIGTIYYDYDPNFKLSWIFEVVGGLKIPEEYFCKDIEKKEDKFTNTIKYNSPDDQHVFFIKENNITYIYLKSHGNTLQLDAYGAIILLDNDSKIESKNAKIDVNADGGSYTYSTLFALTPDQITQLSQNQITDYRLNIYDFKIDKGEGWYYKEYLKCLSKK